MRNTLTLAVLLLASLSPRPGNAADGWTQVALDGTTCWDGKPWHFYFRPGMDKKLVVYFQGGGACWNAASCDPRGRPTFDLGLSASDHPLAHGLFDLRRSDNPISEWNIAFLPYCTGDVHIGAKQATYERSNGTTYTFRHNGQSNTRAALDWLASRMIAQGVAPDTVLVAGESAGGIAAGFWGREIGERFESAQLVVLGEAAGGYRAAYVNAMLAAWGVLDTLPHADAFADRSKVYFETFYVATNERHPAARLAQVNYADDRVQRQLLGLMGSPVEQLTKGLTCNLNEIRLDAPGFHSFIYPGDAHVMLRTNGLYTARCEGVALIDWIGDLLAGRPVVNHWCDGTAGAFADAHIPRL